jgi:hypothetical protein
VVINHADNFFAFSASMDDAQNASKALSSGIAGLPGGEFAGKVEQCATAQYGFRMLGCDVSISLDGLLDAFPTDRNLKKLSSKAWRQRQRTYARLTAATFEKSLKLRMKGIQDYLRFQSIVRGWLQAFAFCGPDLECIKQEYEFEFDFVRHTFEITEAELKLLKDASTNNTLKWYSGS